MNTIQEVKNMSQHLYEYVSAYLKGMIAEEEPLVVCLFFNNVFISIGNPDKVDGFSAVKRYAFSDLVRSDDIGGLEPDQKKLWSIAEEWLM